MLDTRCLDNSIAQDLSKAYTSKECEKARSKHALALCVFCDDVIRAQLIAATTSIDSSHREPIVKRVCGNLCRSAEGGWNIRALAVVVISLLS